MQKLMDVGCESETANSELRGTGTTSSMGEEDVETETTLRESSFSGYTLDEHGRDSSLNGQESYQMLWGRVSGNVDPSQLSPDSSAFRRKDECMYVDDVGLYLSAHDLA